MIQTFRYIRHVDVAAWLKQGWTALPALEGTHHGEWSVLMQAPPGYDEATGEKLAPKIDEAAA